MEFSDLEALKSRIVHSEDEQEIGAIAAFHVDQQTDQPLFVEVATRGQAKNLVVPIFGATVAGNLVLPYFRNDLVRGPSIAPDKIMSISEVSYVVRYYDVGEVMFEDHPEHQEVPDEPEPSGTGYRKKPLPPIVYRFESHEDDRDER